MVLPFILYFMHKNTPFNIAIAFILFVIGSLSDTLDGYIARSLKKETKLGAALDQICDKVFTTSIFIMMAILQWVKGINIMPIFVILFRDFAILGLRQFHKIRTDSLGKFKMIVQTLSIFTLFVTALIFPLFGLEILLLWMSCVLTIMSFWGYLRYV